MVSNAFLRSINTTLSISQLSSAEYQSSVLFNRQETVEWRALNSACSCNKRLFSFKYLYSWLKMRFSKSLVRTGKNWNFSVVRPFALIAFLVNRCYSRSFPCFLIYASSSWYIQMLCNRVVNIWHSKLKKIARDFIIANTFSSLHLIHDLCYIKCWNFTKAEGCILGINNVFTIK